MAKTESTPSTPDPNDPRERFRLALEAALRIDANYAPAIYDIAVLYQQEKNYAQAQRAYQRLVMGGVRDADTFFNSGVVAYKSGNLVAAERWFHASGLPPGGRVYC